MSFFKDYYNEFYKLGKKSKEEKKNKPTPENKGILFNLIKYIVALLPIVIPFTIAMIVTKNDILISIFSTIFFDICLIIFGAVYIIKNGK